MPVDFTVRKHEGLVRLTFPQLIHLTLREEYYELPKLQRHQRAQFVTLVAGLIHLGRFYDLANNESSVEEWEAAFAGIPFNLTAPHDQPAFLQVARPNAEWDEVFIQRADCHGVSFPVEHSIKSVWVADREFAAMAIIGGLFATTSGGWAHQGALREKYFTCLVSDDGSIGSEIRYLADAYDQRPEGAKAGSGPKDHFASAWTFIEGQPVENIPWPYFDSREVRFVDEGELVSAVWTKSRPGVKGKLLGLLQEPHVAIQVATKGAKVQNAIKEAGYLWVPERPTNSILSIGSQPLGYHKLHSLLYPNRLTIAPPILSLCHDKRVYVRALGCSTDTGKVNSFHEVIVQMQPGSTRGTGEAEALSMYALNYAHLADMCVRFAAMTLYGEQGKEMTAPRSYGLGRQVAKAFGMASVHEVARLLAQNVKKPEGKKALCALVNKHILDAWTIVTQPYPVSRVTDATGHLKALLHRYINTESKTDMFVDKEQSKEYFGLLAMLDRKMTDGDRKSVRSDSTASVPWKIFGILSYLPKNVRENEHQRAVWIEAIRGLAKMSHGGPSVGRMLADIGYPESRIPVLLNAQGDAYVQQMADVIRFLASRGETANLTDLVMYGVTGDREVGIKIAQEFYRAAAEAA
jgi:hypothetical protein